MNKISVIKINGIKEGENARLISTFTEQQVALGRVKEMIDELLNMSAGLCIVISSGEKFNALVYQF